MSDDPQASPAPSPAQGPPHVVILGGGFAGLLLAQHLKHVPVRVTLLDRRNHHLFQPLLYQVATASLSPADIAWPIRHVLSRQPNARVLLGEAARIDPAQRRVILKDGEINYDVLAVCTGVSHSYFGHPEWAEFAPGLKSVEDAVEIRRRFLLAFEAAEREPDDAARRARLTFIVVGGGPTGVELAGAMAEIARRAIPRDFRSIDTTTARIILVEGENRLLASMPLDLSARAKRDLEQLGVEVILGRHVTAIDPGGVWIGVDRIDAANVLWAAGVAAEPLVKSLGAPLDKNGRVLVNPDLTVPGHPEIFVLGDLASVRDSASNQPVPGIAPAAMQMGRYAAGVIRDRVRAPNDPVSPFRYHDKGVLATIGRARAVGVVGRLHVKGVLAWLLWAGVHITYLISARSRLAVIYDWTWEYLFFQRGARLITGDTDLRLREELHPQEASPARAPSSPPPSEVRPNPS